MIRSTKAALLIAALAVLAAGCGSDYYDDNGYDHHSYYRDHNGYYGDRDSYRDRDSSDRVRVCDADGDDCHWEYRH